MNCGKNPRLVFIPVPANLDVGLMFANEVSIACGTLRLLGNSLLPNLYSAWTGGLPQTNQHGSPLVDVARNQFPVFHFPKHFSGPADKCTVRVGITLEPVHHPGGGVAEISINTVDARE